MSIVPHSAENKPFDEPTLQYLRLAMEINTDVTPTILPLQKRPLPESRAQTPVLSEG